MRKKTGPYNTPKRQPDPRHDAIGSGPLWGRREVPLGIVKAIREDAALLARDLGEFDGIVGKFARDRARTIEHDLRELERVARLPVDPATDYQEEGPGGGGDPAAGL